MSLPTLDMDNFELDKLIHNYEYENQQCVKMIEKKNQQISSLTSQIEEKVQERKRLEEEISRFDEDTKRLHRNYTNNRDNIICLKKTMSVMADHMDALTKQLEALKVKTVEENKSYSEYLTNYTSTRDDYMAKYRAFPLAKELEEAQKVVETLQERDREVESRKTEIGLEIAALEDELDTQVMSRILVKFGEAKSCMHKVEKEIHGYVTEKSVLLEHLKVVQKSKQQEQDLAGETGQPEQLMEADQTIVDSALPNIVNASSVNHDKSSPAIPTNNSDTQCDQSIFKVMTDADQETSHPEQERVSLEPVPASQGTDNDVPMMEVPNAIQSGQVSMQSAGSTITAEPLSRIEAATATLYGASTVLKASQVSVAPGPAQRPATVKPVSNLPRPQMLYQPRMPELGKPRLLSKVPRAPALPRVPPALRIPTLSVPRPMRFPQPSSLNSLKKAQPSAPPAVTTPTPLIKLPSPPPPPKAVASTPLLQLGREMPSLPKLPTLSTQSMSRLNTPVMSSGIPRKLQQQPTSVQPARTFTPADHTGDMKRVGSSTRSYTMPLNDVRESGDEPETSGSHHVKTPEMKNTLVLEEQHMDVSNNETGPVFTSTPNETGDNCCDDTREPLFKLDHTFGSQGSFLSEHSGAKSQPQDEDSIGTLDNLNPQTASAKNNLMSYLNAPSPTGGDFFNNNKGQSEQGENQTSIFNLFNISSQKSDNANIGGTINDNDQVEGGEEGNGGGFSVFKLGQFGVGSAMTDDDDTSGATGGLAGLFGGMQGGDGQSQQDSEQAGGFMLGFGGGKGEDTDNSSDQPSIFNIGGGGKFLW